MIGFGPFSIEVVIIIAAALFAWLVARTVARRLSSPGTEASPAPDTHSPAAHKVAGAIVLDALFWGLVAARLGFIAQWWEDYAAAPMSMLFIGDGGFSWWICLLVALLYAGWKTRSRHILRRPVMAGIATGMVIWLLSSAAILMMERATLTLMPDVSLMRPDGEPLTLDAYAGRPVVLNLWATWCPPCRREMPVFEEAQAVFPDVAFVMVNQGEGTQLVEDFLETEGLALTDVLLDPWSETMRATGARALPTTLLFDEQGHMVDYHIGELTMASLRHRIQRHFSVSAPSHPPVHQSSAQSTPTHTDEE